MAAPGGWDYGGSSGNELKCRGEKDVHEGETIGVGHGYRWA